MQRIYVAAKDIIDQLCTKITKNNCGTTTTAAVLQDSVY